MTLDDYIRDLFARWLFRKVRRYAFAFLAICLFIVCLCLLFRELSRAQGLLSVKMPDSQVLNILTPGALAALSGESFEPDGAYIIHVADRPATVVSVQAEAILFTVPLDARPGRQKTIWVQGPKISRFFDVEVAPYYPMVRLQKVEGESRPECCAVAVITPRIVPEFVIGAPIVTGPEPATVSVVASGLITGYLPPFDDYRPEVWLEDDRGRILTLIGASWPFPLFVADERVSFDVPPCLDGEFLLRLRLGESFSNAALIRFASACETPARTPRRKRQSQ